MQSKPESRWGSRLVATDKLRFLIAGGSTTAISYGIYLGLLALDVRALPAYVISYFTGIIWSYAINALWVFRSRPHWRSFIRYPLVYAVQALVSFALFKFISDLLFMRDWLIPLAITAITVPITYVLSKSILTSK